MLDAAPEAGIAVALFAFAAGIFAAPAGWTASLVVAEVLVLLALLVLSIPESRKRGLDRTMGVAMLAGLFVAVALAVSWRAREVGPLVGVAIALAGKSRLLTSMRERTERARFHLQIGASFFAGATLYVLATRLQDPPTDLHLAGGLYFGLRSLADAFDASPSSPAAA